MFLIRNCILFKKNWLNKRAAEFLVALSWNGGKGAKLFKSSVSLSYGEKIVRLQIAKFHKEFVDLQFAD